MPAMEWATLLPQRSSFHTMTASNRRLRASRMRRVSFTVPTIRFQVLYVFLVLAHERRRILHPYALINVVVNRPIGRGPGSVAEVRRPAPQYLIQPVPHLLPGPRITGYEKVSHLFLDACHCLLRRAGPQIPTAILLVAMWPERVPEKAKALLARLLDAGLRLIQGDPHACDHLPRPIPCLSRFAATENHEVSRPRESHPGPLSEPYLNLSAHTAPAMEPRRTPICQCANNFGSRREMRAIQCCALRRCWRSFLYFRLAQRARSRSSARVVG